MGSGGEFHVSELNLDVEAAAKEHPQADAQLEVFALSLSVVVPAALNAIIQMGIPGILTDAAHQGRCSLSADEILARFPQAPANANAKNLERLLRVLSFKGVFKEETDETSKRRTFKLTPMSRALVRDPRGGTMMANVALLTGFNQEFIESCKHLRAAVVEDAVPFSVAHDGMNAFEYCGANPGFSKVFQAAMTDHSLQVVNVLLAKYDGFRDVHRMADVGGGVGTTIAQIVERYPHIRGVNYDLSHVIAHAPPSPGVEHIAGDMFVSVPSGCDAYFLKNIMHDWDDEHNITVLKNCYEALPSSGRVIMVDAVLPTSTSPLGESSLHDLCAFQQDINMMACSPRGREREASEWEMLITTAGFTNIKFVKLDYMYVVEATKP